VASSSESVEPLWLHDRQDGNGNAHLEAGLVAPSETIPVIAGQLGLSTWQGVFFCELNGPRFRPRELQHAGHLRSLDGIPVAKRATLNG
jgi:secondary thiamine-phosphate synthase enzyme